MVISLAMRSVLVAGGLPRLPARALQAALGALWLGLLSDRQLLALDACYYHSDRTYRTLHWNERGLFGWEREAIDRAFEPGSRVIVPGCGGGREVLALLELGFDATGYEPHPDLYAFADALLSARGFPSRVFAMPRDVLPAGATGDGVLVGWGAYSLIPLRTRRVEFLKAASRASEGTGTVVLSCFTGRADARDRRVVASLANGIRRLLRRSPIELGDVLAPNRVHVFTAAELESELREAGLEPCSLRTVAHAAPGVDYTCAVAGSPS